MPDRMVAIGHDALVVMTLISDGLKIDGVVTWVLATVLVWLFTVVANMVLVRLVLTDTAART